MRKFRALSLKSGARPIALGIAMNEVPQDNSNELEDLLIGDHLSSTFFFLRNEFLIYFLKHAIPHSSNLIERLLGMMTSLCLSISLTIPIPYPQSQNLRRNATLCHLRIIFTHTVITHSSSESVPSALKSNLPLHLQTSTSHLPIQLSA